MANFSPQPFSTKNDASSIAPLRSSAQPSTTMANLKHLVDELINPDLRENALHVLSKEGFVSRTCPFNLLWNTACIVTIFLQEIISIYPTLSSLELTDAQSARVCNVLALLQVSTFILQKFLANEEGLDHICTTAERFFAVARVLKMVLRSLEEKCSPRLLKLVISCYSRLSNNHRRTQQHCNGWRLCLKILGVIMFF
ncbi:CCR4-NOT transcription complex subunit [Trifolium repens]|nr:CCR4-NOT transcription complex subunit [Trifolium repens]